MRWPGPCAIHMMMRLSFGSTQKLVPANPAQRVFPNGPQLSRDPCFPANRESEPEAPAWEGILGVSKLVRGHILNRLSADETYPIQLAAIQQHLAKARVIHGRGNSTLPARLILRGDRDVDESDRSAA